MNRETLVKFRDFATLNPGQSPKSEFYSNSEGLPFLQGNRTFGLLYPKIDTYTTKTTKIAEKGEILMSVRAPVGDLNFAKEKVCIGRGIAGINAKDGNNKFLFYCLKYNIKNLIKQSGGTTYNSVNKDIINDFDLIMPRTTLERKVVAKILSDLDAKIELNNKINTELEAMAKLIYDYWFVQFDFPDENGKPYKTSGGKMIYNEELKREIPEGWEVKELGNCIDLFDSKRVPLSRAEREKIEGNIPYYGATSIMGYVNDFIFDDEYILLAEDGSVMNEKGFPIVQFIWGKTWVNNHAHVIQAKNKIHNEFIFQLVKMIQVILIKSGSIQMKINQNNLTKYKVLIPSEKLINDYSLKASSIRKQLINNIEQNQKLAELRDWLLPMLMNGQVRVK